MSAPRALVAIAFLGVASCKVVSNEGGACFNDGNCPGGQLCCDGTCRIDCGGADGDDRRPSTLTAQLLVSVVSDLAPFVDFDGLAVRLDDADEVDSVITPAMHFDKARVIARLDEVPVGSHAVHVRLKLGTATVLRREVDLELLADTEVHVALNRVCLLISCPGDGDALGSTVCHGGQCTPPTCSSVSLEACGAPQCAYAGQCTATTSCARVGCVDGLCVEYADDMLCAATKACRLGVGCVDATAQCAGDGDCDDVIACTRDRCVDGRCRNLVDDSVCKTAACRPFASAASSVTGCLPPPCSSDTCHAAHCQSAACIEGECSVTPVCQSGEQCCGDICGQDCATPHACEGRAAGSVCRPAAGACDAVEQCDGLSPDCPPDAVSPALTICRSAVGACDLADACDGTSAVCTDNELVAAGTVCHPSTGACDAAETCTGDSPVCPIDLLEPSTAICRAAAGSCDVAEQCTGTSAQCPGDTLRPGQTCREAAGSCDVAEFCGAGPLCPADVLRPSTLVCRDAVTACDKVEKCTGTAALCPSDVKMAAGTVCLAAQAAQPCQSSAICDGSTDACPARGIKPINAVCRALSGACDIEDRCNGTTTACLDRVQSGNQCSAGSVCVNSSVCDGVSHACPAGELVSDGVICDTDGDGNNSGCCNGACIRGCCGSCD